MGLLFPILENPCCSQCVLVLSSIRSLLDPFRFFLHLYLLFLAFSLFCQLSHPLFFVFYSFSPLFFCNFLFNFSSLFFFLLSFLILLPVYSFQYFYNIFFFPIFVLLWLTFLLAINFYLIFYQFLSHLFFFFFPLFCHFSTSTFFYRFSFFHIPIFVIIS